jgi:predicted Rossmann fold nucleotide-binding protein DprA/Smf involved in DNA uptake
MTVAILSLDSFKRWFIFTIGASFERHVMTTSILLPGQLFASETETIGNAALLSLEKTAFLCSRNIPASAVLKCYDWAMVERDAGHCIISGFHSQIEKDVLEYLLKGKQPIIVCPARGLGKTMKSKWKSFLDEGRLLIITTFSRQTKRVTAETALARNRLMMDLADKIVVGYVKPDGSLASLLGLIEKPLCYLDR